MLGAIAGDMIGSPYEFNNNRTKEFPLFTDRSSFTDDTILSVAVAELLLDETSNTRDYAQAFQTYGRRYPHPTGGYGARFSEWIWSDSAEPYGSWGNGSAMRVSPIGFAFDDMETVLTEAKRSAEVTHNHPEGIKGAQATAAAIFMARTGASKAEIRAYVESTFGYDLQRSVEEVRPVYRYNESCQETVPEALIAFLDATDCEDAIRNAVSLGGDSDTLTCITGGIADAFYGVPEAIAQEVLSRLDDHLRGITQKFLNHVKI
ncbi:MAG: ADP-ribosylglycohydrolase family protein [Leptolyngbyaceae bacterium]|nr:ADP-ribosylglycohydrolase family protein [Leptolyngbyaceae bacterium]